MVPVQAVKESSEVPGESTCGFVRSDSTEPFLKFKITCMSHNVSQTFSKHHDANKICYGYTVCDFKFVSVNISLSKSVFYLGMGGGHHSNTR